MQITPIPKQTKTLEELLEYAKAGWHLDIKPDTYIRYISLFEKENSKAVKNDWDYYLNLYGFRGPWRMESNTRKIGFFGCSCTFGVGVHHDYIFSNIVEKYYGSQHVESLNMGLPGSGIARIAKLVSAATRIIDFDTVIITAPSSTRFLVLDEEGSMVDIVPGFSRKEYIDHEKFIYGKLGQSTLDMYFTDYVHWIEAELTSVNRVLWSTWCLDTYKLLEQVVDKDNLLPFFNFVDYGRDKHPGILSHQQYASGIINKIGNLNEQNRI